ncbi:hypothetical protein PHET_00104 [Paragonimus heterotremus]|uniref:Uncharacterized protein n=1 Tax=Paragonimus heterotremus TaxID=100268 RepID=A0A8J4T5D8_9TREM|nr:hypothetical protein PHET_00104 [Paragonimus heterotremus]
MSFADALAKIREEETSDEDEQKDQEEQILAAATPFDTTTQLGQNLAKLSQAFADLLEAQRPDSAENMARTKRKSKKSRRRSLYEEMEEKSKFRMTLATELNNAAQEEQQIILDKMQSHGKKIDAERRRQSEKTTEKLNEAREKKHGRTDAVESLLDKKEELNELHEKGRSRQEKALKERLEQLKQQEAMESTNEEFKEQSAKRKKKKDHISNLGYAEENAGADGLGSIPPQASDMEGADSETITKSRRKHREPAAELIIVDEEQSISKTEPDKVKKKRNKSRDPSAAANVND